MSSNKLSIKNTRYIQNKTVMKILSAECYRTNRTSSRKAKKLKRRNIIHIEYTSAKKIATFVIERNRRVLSWSYLYQLLYRRTL